jgi:hypothetical protein
MIIYINGRGMNAPELKAYISELEAALKRYESENRELTEKLDELGMLYNMLVDTNGFLEKENKRLSELITEEG